MGKKNRGRAKKNVVIIGLAALFVLVITVSIVVPRLAMQNSEAGPQSAYAKSGFMANLETNADDFLSGSDALGNSLLPGRKNIYDRTFAELAVSFLVPAVYARPAEIEDLEAATRKLAAILKQDEEEVRKVLRSGESRVRIARDLGSKTIRRIKDLGLPGIDITEEIRRFYPHHRTGAHVVGFWEDGQGLDGTEFFYDKVLAERSGGISEENGEQQSHLVLTLDLRMQTLLEQKLQQLMSKGGAVSGSAIVMNPATGGIMALVNLPSYDPNLFWEYDVFERRNSAVSDAVYPGAISRLFSRIFSQGGYVTDSRDGGPLSLKKKKAPRPGTNRTTGRPWRELEGAGGIYLPRENEWLLDDSGAAGADTAQFENFIEHLGFWKQTGIDLPSPTVAGFEGEDVLQRFHPETELSVTTAVHLLAAFSQLMNGGKAVSPHFLKGLWNEKEGFKEARIKRGEGAEQPAGTVDYRVPYALKSVSGDNNMIWLESLVEEKRINEKTKKAERGIHQHSELKGMKKGEKGDGKTFQAVAIGAMPADQPLLSMVIVLKGARMDLSSSSQIRSTTENIKDQLVAWTREESAVPSLVSKVLSRNRIYKKWLAWQNRAEVKAEADRLKKNPVVMPDLRGYSLRKALQVLEPLEVGIKVAGAGQVRGQYPAPGSAVAGANCILELSKGF